MNEKVRSKQDQPVRVMAIFAHPDDADVKMGGTAAKFVELGHKVESFEIAEYGRQPTDSEIHRLFPMLGN